MSKTQGKLEFCVRKTRSASKKLKENESENASPLRRRQFGENLSCNSLCSSPEKRRCLTPTKTEQRNEDVNKRSPLSPLKLTIAENQQNKKVNSPIKINPSLTEAKHRVNIYQEAKAALSTNSNNYSLHCRDSEMEQISSFLQTHVKEEKAGSLYISGAPGSGKTACIEQILTNFQHKLKRAIINCANLNKSKDVFQNICEQLKIDSSSSDYCEALEKRLTKDVLLIVLDEIDYLENRDQSILYKIFEWPALNKSKLILIGVANALDLTSRVLPRLHRSFKCRPQLLHFQPYTKEQIKVILQQRLKMNGEGEQTIIKAAALEFCCRKVASVAGDIRQALDVCRRSIELLEAEIYQKKKSNGNSLIQNDESGVKCVELTTVVSVLNEIYGNSLANRQESDENALPIQQRILLCTLLLIVQHIKLKEITLGKFGDVYNRVCLKHQAKRIEATEFVSICQLLEARGLLQIKHHKDVRQSKVSLRVNEAEIEFALQDKLLLASILTDSAHLINGK